MPRINDLSNMMSDFLNYIKNLIFPIMSLLTQLTHALLNQHDHFSRLTTDHTVEANGLSIHRNEKFYLN